MTTEDKKTLSPNKNTKASKEAHLTTEPKKQKSEEPSKSPTFTFRIKSLIKKVKKKALETKRDTEKQSKKSKALQEVQAITETVKQKTQTKQPTEFKQHPAEKPPTKSSKENQDIKTTLVTSQATTKTKQSKTEVTETSSITQPQTTSEKKKDENLKKPQHTIKKTEETPKKALPTKPKQPPRPQIKLSGLLAFKMEMSCFYEDGKALPVTALYYVPWRVSQIKTLKKDGYTAIQLASQPQKNKRSSKPLKGHLQPAGFKEGARFIKEIRQRNLPENIQVGHELSIESLKKGDFVKIFSQSKGRGFSGVIKRWGFHGGKASHGAKTHRKPGSIGQHAEPSRVFAGRKMPGHYGFKKVCLKKVSIVDVLPEQNMIFVKGSVPGSRHTLVTLKKEELKNNA